MMASFAELPPNAVRRISQLARGRLIEGCNKYARVCKQWRDADFASSSEEEPLQLYVDLRHMSDAEVSSFSTWMSLHGHQVGALVIGANPTTAVRYGWLVESAAALRRLTRLEVAHKDSLALLAPVLGQLPQLQCLAVDIELMDLKQEPSDGAGDGTLTPRFSVAQEPWEELPDMQQLCPQLQQLRLTVHSDSWWADCTFDPRLPQLLPCQLKQLELVHKDIYKPDSIFCSLVSLNTSSLVHLSGLQRLTLFNVDLVDRDLLQHVPGLQQVLGHWPQGVKATTPEWLAPQLVELGSWSSCLEPAMPDLAHVTQLMLFVRPWEETWHPGMLEAVAALPLLRELCVDGDGDDLAPYVRQAAGMNQLCSLQLYISGDAASEMRDCMAQCTQLSSLLLFDRNNDCLLFEALCPGLQQLTGLQSLVVPAAWLACGPSTWLMALSQLTCLQLSMPYEPLQTVRGMLWTVQRDAQGQVECMHHVVAQQLLGRVQHWPASLRHVMFWVGLLSSHCRWLGGGDGPPAVKPRCWELGPAAPGSAGVQVWLEQRSAAAAAWSHPFKACPYFPGVWELQGLVGGTTAGMAGGPVWPCWERSTLVYS